MVEDGEASAPPRPMGAAKRPAAPCSGEDRELPRKRVDDDAFGEEDLFARLES